ncbi:hypothetical protein HaLaN_32319, partial [Haematococcus lacustris]
DVDEGGGSGGEEAPQQQGGQWGMALTDETRVFAWEALRHAGRD